MLHVLGLQVNFSDLDRCQTLQGAATWCLPLARTLTASVGMLYRLPNTGACVCQFGWAMVMVVWQWEVNYSRTRTALKLCISKDDGAY